MVTIFTEVEIVPSNQTLSGHDLTCSDKHSFVLTCL